MRKAVTTKGTRHSKKGKLLWGGWQLVGTGGFIWGLLRIIDRLGLAKDARPLWSSIPILLLGVCLSHIAANRLKEIDSQSPPLTDQDSWQEDCAEERNSN